MSIFTPFAFYGSAPTIAPGVVTDGLVLYLDAGNPASYPGSGNFWTDLSGTQATPAQLSGSFSYTSSFGGALIFNNATPFAGHAFVSSSLSLSSTTITVQTFYNITSYGTFWNILQTKWNTTGGPQTEYHFGVEAIGGGRKIDVYTKTGGPFTGSTAIATGSWYNSAFTIDGSNNLRIYLNGNLDGSYTSVTKPVQVWETIVADKRNNFDINGPLPVTLTYNRALSQAEIQQNYNVFKSRYGLT
jgi:hypothetical protein